MKNKMIIDENILIKKKKKDNDLLNDIDRKNKRKNHKKLEVIEVIEDKDKKEDKKTKKENKIKENKSKENKIKDKKIKDKKTKEESKENINIDNSKKNNKRNRIRLNKKSIIIFSSILVFILIILFVIYSFNNIIFLNSSDLTINVYDSYIEPGYKANLFGYELVNKVKVKNNINVNEFGDYKVVYSLKLGNLKFKKIRNIKVFDIEPPKIDLVGDSIVHICKGSFYSEDGFSANDNYDGELTNFVKTKVYTDKVIYKVKDKNNNQATIVRKIDYNDIIPPEIKLNGGSTIIYNIGGNYQDNGYYATDNCDGDISDKVVVDGVVDTNKVGEYNLTYTIKDSSDNEVSIERKVTVVDMSTFSSNSDYGVIYLTFDDGPQEGSTNGILDILKKFGVKATFFVTGKGPDYLIEREYNEGHTVALHSATHNYSYIYSSVDNYFNDLYSIQNRVQRLTGTSPRIIRFPGGSSNMVSKSYTIGIMSYLSREVQNRGFTYFDWNVSSGDAGGTDTASGVYNNVVAGVSKYKSNIVLMHDVNYFTMDALESIIQFGLQNGYEFKRITESTTPVHHNIAN